MKIDIDVPISAPLADQLAYVRRAEALGLDGVAVGDNPSFGYDPFVTLAAAAGRTDRLALSVASTNPVARHPAQLAAALHSLNGLAPGRVRLGIAVGDSGAAAIGAAPASVRRLREAVLDIKARLGEFGLDPAPPIMVTASGPRTLALAGEVGDEVLAAVGLDGAVREKAERLIRDVAAQPGDAQRTPPITWYTLLSIDEDESKAVERTRYWLTLWLRQGMLRLAVETLGLAVDGGGLELSFPALRALATRLFLAGTPQTVAHRLETLADEGVERLLCLVPGGLRAHQRTLEQLAALGP